VLRQVSPDRFEFVEREQPPVYFTTQEAFVKYLESRSDQIAFWEIEIHDRIFYKYWDEVSEKFENFLSRKALYHAMAKDGGGTCRIILGSKTSYVRDCSGYFNLDFQEFESEALFLEVMQHDAKRRAFRLKCFAGVAGGVAVGAGAYAYYANQHTEEDTSTAVAQPQAFSPQFSQSKLSSFHVAQSVLPNITLTEEIAYQSQEWVISDIFGSAMNGATIIAEALPQGLEILNQPIRIINVETTGATNGPRIIRRDNFLLFLHTYLDTINIADPLKLTTINRFILGLGITLDCVIQKDYLFLIHSMNNYPLLMIMDVRDLIHNVQIVSTTSLEYMQPGSAAMAINNNNSCFIVSVNSYTVELSAYDVSNKSLPQLKSLLNFGTGFKVTTRGNTLSFVGTPEGGTQGNYQITLTATSQQGKSAQAYLNLFVKPAITVQFTIPDQFAVVGSFFNFFIDSNTFKHINNHFLTYAIDPQLDWLHFNQQSGALSGTPKYAGDFKFQITAKDGSGATTSTPLNLKVVYGPTPNHPIENQVIATSEFFALTIPVDTFVDRDKVDLTYSVTNNGLPLPAWLKFDSTTRILSGTPTAIDVGTLQIVVQAKDPNGLSAETYFQLQISMPTGLTLRTPVANQIALVGQFFRFYVPSDTFIATGYTIKYTAKLRDGSELPSWLAFVNQTFAGTPGRGDTNSFSDRVLEVTLTAHT